MQAQSFRPSPLDPRPAHHDLPETRVLERPNEEITALIQRHQGENPCLKHTNRVRPAGPTSGGLVDRLPAPGDSLAEHLSHQLRLRSHPPRVLALADWIVWNLDPHGYLRDDLSELAEMAGAERVDIERALAVVQSLDPTGVGARSLQECLLLQLQVGADSDAVAIELVKTHLTALSEGRCDDLARRLGQSRQRILQALAAIRRLEPRPGRAFGDAVAQTVSPDVAIEKSGEGYRVVMRDDDVPHVGVSRQRWAEAAAAEGDARRYLANQIHAAGRLLTALERRRETVRGVVESIVRRQPDFLEHGPDRLRPLSLREVAVDVGVHESTVSRAVAHSYVDTPHGVSPLRSFFTGRLPADPGGLVSSLAARRHIRDAVDAEDPRHPLADGQIARALETAGICIARRTVVKYRDLLGIASAPQRRYTSA